MFKHKIEKWVTTAVLTAFFGGICASAGADTIRVGPGYTYETIQEGVQAAQNGDTVLVEPVVYQEEVDFLGKAITVRGDGAGAVIAGEGGLAVVCIDNGGVLKNFVIKNGTVGILCGDGTPVISQVTVVNNTYGLTVVSGGTPQISNSIFWYNSQGDLDGAEARYCCVQDGAIGEGNISLDPLFADLNEWDYHLRSQTGRFDPDKPGESGWTEPVQLSELNDGQGNAAGVPCLSGDELTIYFDRHIPALGHHCIVEAYRDEPEGPFSNERICAELSTTGYSVNAPWISEDGLRLYYKENYSDSNRIKMAQRSGVNETWTPSRIFDELHEDGARGTEPALTADELIIVWHSRNRPGSAGGIDLWMATRPSMESPFGNIRPLYEINTTENETGPHLLPDGLTLYFTAQNRDGYSGINTFKATRSSLSDAFGNVQLVEIPGYSTMNVSRCWVSPSEKVFCFENEATGQGVFVCRWMEDQWVFDNETSPCIDGGDPTVNPMDESRPNGARVNMGAYGGTEHASKSDKPWPNPCDINQDGRVDILDFAQMSGEWLWTAPWVK